VAARSLKYLGNPVSLTYPLRNNITVFVERSSECVDQFSALVDESFPGTKQYCSALLLGRLCLNKAHFRPLCRDYDRLRVRCIILLPFHKRFYVMRCNQLHLMTKSGHLACPVMRTTTGFHYHHRWWLLCHEPGETLPRQLLTKLWAPRHRGRV